jgi:hypothetical protein
MLPYAFTSAYDVTRNTHTNTLQDIADRLAQICVSLNEFPHIRFSVSNVRATRLAFLLQDALEQAYRAHSGFKFYGEV